MMNKTLLNRIATEGLLVCNSYSLNGYKVNYEMEIEVISNTNTVEYILACSILDADGEYVLNIENGVSFANINLIGLNLVNYICKDENSKDDCIAISQMIQDIKNTYENEVQ